jgi:hypothetical protein
MDDCYLSGHKKCNPCFPCLFNQAFLKLVTINQIIPVSTNQMTFRIWTRYNTCTMSIFLIFGYLNKEPVYNISPTVCACIAVLSLMTFTDAILVFDDDLHTVWEERRILKTLHFRIRLIPSGKLCRRGHEFCNFERFYLSSRIQYQKS